MDETIGRNVALYRGDRPQQWLADQMRIRGYKWSQATVWAVEKGSRPLRFAEARDVCLILQIGTDRLVDLASDAALRAHVDTLRHRAGELRAAARSYLATQIKLREMIKSSLKDAPGRPGSHAVVDALTWAERDMGELLKDVYADAADCISDSEDQRDSEASL